jgi:hypothetical protein
MAERIGAVQRQATDVIAGLIASDPEAPLDPGLDPAERALRIEVHAQLLSGAVQSLATWWHEHQEIPRDVLVDRAMEFCWQGVERLPERAVVEAASPVAR